MPARKLLLVEDDATLSEVYQQVLREAAFDLDTAANGNDALLFIHIIPLFAHRTDTYFYCFYSL